MSASLRNVIRSEFRLTCWTRKKINTCVHAKAQIAISCNKYIFQIVHSYFEANAHYDSTGKSRICLEISTGMWPIGLNISLYIYPIMFSGNQDATLSNFPSSGRWQSYLVVPLSS